MKLDLLIAFSTCVESSGASLSLTSDRDCRLLHLLKKLPLFERVDVLQVGACNPSAGFSKAGEGQLSPVFRHVSPKLPYTSGVLMRLVMVDDRELVHSLLCKQSERSDETGDSAADVGSLIRPGEKYVVSSNKGVIGAGVGCSDGGKDSGSVDS